MAFNYDVQRFKQLEAKSTDVKVLTDKCNIPAETVFLNTRFTVEGDALYFVLKNGFFLKKEVKALQITLQRFLKNKIKHITVYQYTDNPENMLNIRTVKQRHPLAEVCQEPKLFELTGNSSKNDLIDLQTVDGDNKATTKHLKQQMNNALRSPEMLKQKTFEQKQAKKVINNLSSDLQLTIPERMTVKQKVAYIAGEIHSFLNKNTAAGTPVSDFSVSVNFFVSNRQYKDEHGYRRTKANFVKTGEKVLAEAPVKQDNATSESEQNTETTSSEPTVSMAKPAPETTTGQSESKLAANAISSENTVNNNDSQSTVETNSQSQAKSEPTMENDSQQEPTVEDSIVEILQHAVDQQGNFKVRLLYAEDVTTMQVFTDLALMEKTKQVILQSIAGFSALCTNGEPDVGFDFEVNSLSEAPADLAQQSNIKPASANSQTSSESSTPQSTSPVAEETPETNSNNTTTDNTVENELPENDTVEDTASLWDNSIPNEEFDSGVVDYNMTASAEQVQQVTQQLNDIAKNNNQDVSISCEIKNNILYITLTLDDKDKDSILGFYTQYKDVLKDTVNNNFDTINVDNIEFKTVSVQAEQAEQQNELEQQVNVLLKQHLAGVDDRDILYQYNVLKANYGSNFRMNLHFVNSDVTSSEIKNLRFVFKDNLEHLERIRINTVPAPLEGLKTVKLHIPHSQIADLINQDEFKEFDLGKNFTFNVLQQNAKTTVNAEALKEKIQAKRKDPNETYVFKFENAETPADSFTDRNGREWDKMMFLACDFNNVPFKVSLFGSWDDKTNKALNKLSHGDVLAAQGKFDYDKFNKTNVLGVQALQILSKEHIQDNSNEKGRYELHSHSKMSQLASINNPDDLINKAVKNGFGGIAFTDDVSTQSYPHLINAQNKFKGFKPIFGTELNMITNKPTFVHNPNNISFTDENTTYVAFDIETTGFALRYNDIIELSMVKYKPKKEVVQSGKNKGQVNYVLEEIDHDRQLVKTNREIPQAVLDLTKITVQDLQLNGISIQEALQNFINFIDGDNTILIGHNVHFDIDFINQKLKENNFDYQIDKEKEVLDTLTIARRFVPNKRAYNLTALSKTLKIHLEQAHTAVYDAQATGFVWMALYNVINENNDVQNGIELEKLEENSDHAYQEGFSNTFSALAINQKGIKNIYRMISVASTQHFYREAKLYPFEIKENHPNVLLGSGGYNSLFWKYAYEKTIDKAKNLAKEMQYDYLEVAPFEAYGLPEYQRDAYEDTVKQILKVGDELQIPVIAITDTHQLNDEHFDNLAYEILVSKDKVPTTKLHHTPFYTTDELFKQFDFLDKITEQQIIVDNTVKIAEQISNDIKPIVTDVTPPHIKGADEQLRKQTMDRAYELYGNPLPPKIKDRVETELNFIIKGGYAVHYIVAQKVVQESEKMGYLVGSRGSVGSSIVAFLMGITEVNALPAHYRSKHGDYFEWTPDYADGWDLPPKADPNHPGEMLVRDGHNIPFSTFLGLKGTKVPDIDLNASKEVQAKLQLFLKHYFGAEHTIRVGTITGLAQGNTKMFVRKYEESRMKNLTPAEKSELQFKLEGVKQTTGQHPAGIMIVPDDKDILDYTPYNYPSNKPGEWITTHYVASDMHDALLKMDVLGHGDPSVLHMLQKLTGVNPHTIDVSDPKIIELFTKNDVDGLPEFDTQFARGILEIAKPKKFSDLVQISGLSHGTKVWEGNAKDLIQHDGKTLEDVIGNRDKIVLDLLDHGLDIAIADGISKVVKKGKPLKPEVVQAMRDHNVPEWYIDSLKKITYLYPKAHAAAYVMSALRIAYFKVYYPVEFYATIMTYRSADFDIEALCSNDVDVIKSKIDYYLKKAEDYERKKPSDKPTAASLRMALHAMEHGVRFDMPSLKRSDSYEWLISKDNHNHLIIPLEAMHGFGAGAAQSAVEYRKEHNGVLPSDVKVVKDKKNGMGLNKSILDQLEKMGLIEIHTEYKTAYTKTGKKKKNPDKIQTITYN